MALFSPLGDVVGWLLGLTHSHKCRCWRCTVRRLGREPEQTETSEKREEAAAIFSAVCGIQIITQEEAERQREENNRVIREVDIKDIFFNPTEATFWNDKGQEPLFYVSDSAYDSKYDYDFTNLKPEGNNDSCQRGDYSYKRPCGWRRKALKVLGTYEDDIWLGKPGWRSKASPGEWEVSYHGPNIRNLMKDIIDRGYNIDINKDVIYSTPCIKVAERFAVKFSHDDQEYLCILQNRVNLKNIEVISEKDTGVEGPFFVAKDVEDMRPYGLCLKKL